MIHYHFSQAFAAIVFSQFSQAIQPFNSARLVIVLRVRIKIKFKGAWRHLGCTISVAQWAVKEALLTLLPVDLCVVLHQPSAALFTLYRQIIMGLSGAQQTLPVVVLTESNWSVGNVCTG